MFFFYNLKFERFWKPDRTVHHNCYAIFFEIFGINNVRTWRLEHKFMV